MTDTFRNWLARALIGAVLIINVQSALIFFLQPARFAPAYELSGVPGQAAIRGFAVLFFMWNVPYVVAFANPAKFRVSLYEAIVMQGIGLIGESLILWSIPMDHTLLRISIMRFIIFDSCGLVILITAAWITRSITKHRGN